MKKISKGKLLLSLLLVSMQTFGLAASVVGASEANSAKLPGTMLQTKTLVSSQNSDATSESQSTPTDSQGLPKRTDPQDPSTPIEPQDPTIPSDSQDPKDPIEPQDPNDSQVPSAVDVTAPQAPTDLKISSQTDSSATLTWTASKDDVAVTGYEVYVNSKKVADSTDTSYTINDLLPNVEYKLTVKAKDAAGNLSEVSNEATITIKGIVKLATTNEWLFEVEDLQQTDSGDTTVTNKDANASGGTFEGYTSNAVNDYIEYTVNVPVAGKYTIKVKTKTNSARGIAQLTVDGVTQGPPMDQYNTTTSYDEISLGEITFATTGNKKFRFTVVGKNSSSSVYTLAFDAIRLVTPDSQAPTVPSNLISTSKTSSSVTLSWVESTDNVSVTGYDIYSGTSKVGTSNTTSYTVSGLTPNTPYTFTVKAKDVAGNVSAASNALTETTNVAGAAVIFEAETLQQADSGDTTTLVTDSTASGGKWESYGADAVEDFIEYAVSVPESGKYEVLVGLKKFTNRGIAQLSVDNMDIGQPIDAYGTTAAITEVNAGPVSFNTKGFKVFRFTITGKNGASTGYVWPIDYIKLVKQVDTEAPSAPTNLFAVNQISNSISLKWTGSRDNVGVTGYLIYQNGIRIATVSGTNYTVNNLTPNTPYTYVVKARDAAGNISESSNVLNTRTSTTALPLPLSLGIYHSTFLKADGTVWSWGYNGYGNLGNSTTGTSYNPVAALNLSSVKMVANGKYHSLALKADGTAWAWGYNGYGQLGDASTTNRYTATQVQGITDVTSIAAGDNHTLLLKSDGTVWAIGRNHAGQLGDETNTDRKTAVQVKNLTNVIAIAAGRDFSMALKNDGTVWTWGYNNEGELGNGTKTSSNAAVQVSGLSDVKAISAGGYHGLALKNDGKVWAWGYNGYGQLGNNSTVDQLVPVQVSGLEEVNFIAAGNNHSLALKQDGTAWAWGNNGNGNLGIGSNTSRNYPVQITSLPKMSAISAGENQNVAVSADGILYSWGQNNYGQLGNGTNADSWAPQKVIGPNVNPADVQAPGTITDLRLQHVNSQRTITLTWSYTGDDVGVAKYEIYNGNVLVATQEPWNNSVAIYNLAINTDYKFNIRAIDATGNRAVAGNTFSYTNTDRTLPGTPTNLVLTGVTTSTITLYWSTSSDNDVVKQYNIYRDGTKVGSTASNSFTITGLTSKTNYNITVKAEDDSGNESLASIALAVKTE